MHLMFQRTPSLLSTKKTKALKHLMLQRTPNSLTIKSNPSGLAFSLVGLADMSCTKETDFSKETLPLKYTKIIFLATVFSQPGCQAVLTANLFQALIFSSRWVAFICVFIFKSRATLRLWLAESGI